MWPKAKAALVARGLSSVLGTTTGKIRATKPTSYKEVDPKLLLKARIPYGLRSSVKQWAKVDPPSIWGSQRGHWSALSWIWRERGALGICGHSLYLGWSWFSFIAPGWSRNPHAKTVTFKWAAAEDAGSLERLAEAKASPPPKGHALLLFLQDSHRWSGTVSSKWKTPLEIHREHVSQDVTKNFLKWNYQKFLCIYAHNY